MAVRDAQTAHVETVQKICAAHILTDVAAFKAVLPDQKDMAQGMRGTQTRRLPYPVSTGVEDEAQGVAQGFAYARPVHIRSAYR